VLGRFCPPYSPGESCPPRLPGNFVLPARRGVLSSPLAGEVARRAGGDARLTCAAFSYGVGLSHVSIVWTG
jgi:hypothetical protein